MKVFRRVRRLLRPAVLRDHFDVLRDYVSFRFRYAYFRSIHGPVSGGKRVLVVSLTDWVTQVKMEGVFLKKLEQEGCRVTVVTYRSNKRAQLYFRAFGTSDFVYFDDLLTETKDAVDRQVITRMLDPSRTFAEWRSFVEDSVRIGTHVLSTVVRRLRHGSVEFGDPHVQAQLAKILPLSLNASRAAKLLCERIRPDYALFLEKGYTPYAEIFDRLIQYGAQAVQYVHSQKTDALILWRYRADIMSTHPFSLSADTWKQVKTMPWSVSDEEEFMKELRKSYEEGLWFNRKFLQTDKRIKTPDEVRDQLGLDRTKKTAVIFSHVLWDATFFFGTNLFADYEEWLVETVKVACKNDQVNWLIKLHPDYVWKMKQMGLPMNPRDTVAIAAKVGTLPPHVHVVPPDTDISTYSFFGITDYCITVRGTIGIEAPCFGIPVITAGTGRYSGLGFTNDSDTREQYLGKLANIQDIPALSPGETRLARLHAHALFDLRPLTFDSFLMTQSSLGKLGRVLDHNLDIRPKTLADFSAAQDLQAFADWMLGTTADDYVALS